jgi:ribonuclease HII
MNKRKMICGIDEVGRGALAGPLVAAAVVMPSPFCHPGLDPESIQNVIPDLIRDPSHKVLDSSPASPAGRFRWNDEKITIRDSKRMTPKQREQAFRMVQKLKIPYLIEEISTVVINHRGIGWANKEAIKRLIRKVEADKYIVDGNMKLFENTPPCHAELGSTSQNKNNGTLKQVQGDKANKTYSVIDADATILPVILASIVAKFHRDRLMQKLHLQYPHYYWFSNVGYGTKKHIEMLNNYGMCRFHRVKFVKTALKNWMIKSPRMDHIDK